MMRGRFVALAFVVALLAGCTANSATEGPTQEPPQATADARGAAPAEDAAAKDDAAEDVQVTVTSTGITQDMTATMAHARLENPSDRVVGVSLVLTVKDAGGRTITVAHDRAVLPPTSTSGVVTLLSVAEGAPATAVEAHVTVQTVEPPADPPRTVTAQDVVVTHQTTRRYVTGLDHRVNGTLVSTVPGRPSFVRVDAICTDDAGTVVAAGSGNTREAVTPDAPLPFQVALIGGRGTGCEVTATAQA